MPLFPKPSLLFLSRFRRSSCYRKQKRRHTTAMFCHLRHLSVLDGKQREMWWRQENYYKVTSICATVSMRTGATVQRNIQSCNAAFDCWECVILVPFYHLVHRPTSEYDFPPAYQSVAVTFVACPSISTSFFLFLSLSLSSCF